MRRSKAENEYGRVFASEWEQDLIRLTEIIGGLQ